MRTGTHARGDASFGRSASSQTAKGAALLALAVVIGFVLLHTAPPSTSVTTTSRPPRTRTPKATRRAPASTLPGPTTTAKPVLHPTGQVHVLVANGTSVGGLGARVRGQLSSAGYNTDKPAINATSNVATTAIYYQPGYGADALALATTLTLGPTSVFAMPSPAPVPAGDLAGVDVLVIAGNDIAGGGASSAQAPPGATVAPSATEPSGSTTGTATTIRRTVTTQPRTTTTIRRVTTTTTANVTTTTKP